MCHLGCHITFAHHVYLGSPWPWGFLRLALFLMTLTYLRSTSQALCIMSLHYCVFLRIRLELCILRGKITEVKCHFHHIVSSIYTINMTYNSWCWPWPAQVMFVSFLHCKVTPFSLLFMLYSLAGSHYTQPKPKE